MKLLKEYKEIKKISEKTGGERNLFDFLIYRPLATWILVFLKDSKITPNQATTLSILFSLLAGFFLYFNHVYFMLFMGTIVLNISLLFDTLDGQISRYKGLKSEFGAWYDSVSDSLKYIIIFISLSLGQYYNHPTQDPQSLIMGIIIISNLFMIYFIHGTRYKLSFNPDNMATLGGEGKKRRFFIGIESTLYVIFSIFLFANQVRLLFIVLLYILPIFWIYPFYKVYQNSKKKPLEP